MSLQFCLLREMPREMKEAHQMVGFFGRSGLIRNQYAARRICPLSAEFWNRFGVGGIAASLPFSSPGAPSSKVGSFDLGAAGAADGAMLGQSLVGQP